MSDFKCRICDSSNNLIFNNCFDFHLGLNQPFTYFECQECNCIQIGEFPDNMSEHYPSHYYSFKNSNSQKKSIKNKLRKARDRYALTGKGVLGFIMNIKQPYKTLEIIKKTGVKLSSRVLDVGCGQGEYLNLMSNCGFVNLEGIDPFIPKDILENNVKILKKDIFQLNSNYPYDLIMLHHSFEHMQNPYEVLVQISQLLKKGGKCLIRIPKIPSYGWRKFGVQWFHLDAPRHLFIHSKESIKFLIKNTDLNLIEIIDDMKEISIWGSIQYQKGISFYNKNSYLNNHSESIFSNSDMVNFKEISNESNKNGEGDTAAFIIEKS